MWGKRTQVRPAKLCVTVTAETTAELREKRDRVRDADLVELRLDTVRDPDPAAALHGRRAPVIVTCRPKHEGGHFAGTDEERRAILAAALAIGAEYVDIEWNGGCADLLQQPGGKRIVLFAVPGAFTRTCSQVHLPSFVQQADAIKAKGVDEIVCLAVNDVNVLAAWAREHGATGKINMVSDGLAELTRAIGLDQDLSERGLGVRSKRYAMIIEDGKVSDIQVEPPGACDISKGDAVLQRLG